MTKRSTTSRSKSRSSSSRTSSRRGSSGRSSSSRSRTSSKKKPTPREPLWSRLTPDQQLDILGVILFFLAAFTVLSLFSGNQGKLPKWWTSLLSVAFGWGMYFIPLFLGTFGLWLILRRFKDRLPEIDPEQPVGVALAFLALLISMHLIASYLLPNGDALYELGKEGIGGGMLGAWLSDMSIQALGKTGTIITLFIGWLIIITFIAGISPADAIRMLANRSFDPPVDRYRQASQMSLPSETAPATGPPTSRATPKILGGNEVPAKPKPNRRKKKSQEPTINTATSNTNGSSPIKILPLESQIWRLPAVEEILEEGSEQYFSEDLIRKQSRIIEETLVSLGAPARVNEINSGPVVTQFGVEPLFLTSRAGKTTKVKVSKIAGLADDLALALSARSIRIQAPIPGKGLVGVEVPNEESAVVSLLDVMESEGFDKLKGRLRLGLGHDVSGQAVSADLRTMPHLLIAGATGSGKSVCVNSVIAAMLLQNSPDTLRLLMVDPKRVELTQYNGIPHLLAPVIVDVEQVVPALRWVMREMDSRYRRFAQIGARNIEDFNTRTSKLEDESPIPYIAVLVDELADLMMQSPEETERVICRLAQMARATGIHLIIATQRPSVDVVTGLIKANFPARIAFAVASSIDSRVILDSPGAERLLGRGDMLFMPPDVSQPLRLQGAFVSDHELDKLINYWRTAVEPTKAPEQVTLPKASIASPIPDEATQTTLFPEFDDREVAAQFEDALLPSAVEIFLAENRASTSLLQRRLRIGYTRAARLMDQLTDMGIVSLETKGQFRTVNRAVAEALLQSLHADNNIS